MLLPAKQIDDFKTDRKDIMPPLPVLLRLVPLLFYCSIGVALILGSIFFLQLQLAAQKLESHRTQTGSLEVQTQEAKNQRIALEAEIKKATNIQAWVESSRPIQPLLVDIARSMGPRSSIIDLRLDRDADAPAQLKFSIKLGTDSTKQLDITLDKIAKQDYRTFSPQQNLGRGELDYRATLVSRLQRQAELPVETQAKP